MPTFDGGHYFLTALLPIQTSEINAGSTFTSPVHELRKRLAMVPTAAQTLACGGGQSAFARNTRNHFVRFVIIDDVAYNGRQPSNAIVTAILNRNPVVAEVQDHLPRPYLLFIADFDAESGLDSERDSYLAELWQTMAEELRDIFAFCKDFESAKTDANGFANYVAKRQIETTMSFNDYYIDPPKLPGWPAGPFKAAAILCVAALVLGIAAALILTFIALFTHISMPLWHWAFGLGGTGLTGIIAVAAAAYVTIMKAGAKPFPAAEDAKLPAVLKSLYLQRVFTQFAIDNQQSAYDSASAQKLSDAFSNFVALNRPDDLASPTQASGVIGL